MLLSLADTVSYSGECWSTYAVAAGGFLHVLNMMHLLSSPLKNGLLINGSGRYQENIWLFYLSVMIIRIYMPWLLFLSP
jgi:hypothetical protein